VVPIRNERGDVLGVAGVDTTLGARLATTALPTHVAEHADVRVVQASPDGSVRVVAKKDYAELGRPEDLWRFDIELEELSMPEGAAGRRVRAHLAAGHSGVVHTTWNGRAGVLAYAPMEPSEIVLLVFVAETHAMAPSRALRARLDAQLSSHLREISLWAFGVLGSMVVLGALAFAVASRRVPRSAPPSR
jgi:hypothetical protein